MKTFLDTKKEIDDKFYKMKLEFESGDTKSYEYRRRFLQRLYEVIRNEEENIKTALYKDLNKTEIESYMSEIAIVIEEIKIAKKKLKNWMKPRRIIPSITQMPSKIREFSEPFGVCLIISPWNYPFQLSLCPIIGAVSAGNTVVLKTSQKSKNANKIIKKIFEDKILSKSVSVISGGDFENETILKKKFNYIFFTGSPKVGKIILDSAKDNLRPTTLELGGKSPAIVEQSADIEKTVKRICFGKFLNAGQTCIAPDYIIVEKKIKKVFLEKLIEEIKRMIPNIEYFKEKFPKIINNDHYERLKCYLKEDDIEILFGGEFFDETCQIYPTIISCSMTSKAMENEIFGPILPILEWEKFEDILEIINTNPNPLSLYIFTDNNKLEKKINEKISFGGGCINDTISHIISPKAGFGGVGNSGMGRYHGKYSFDTFSHKKTILKKSWYFDFPVKYHPYTERKFRIIKKIMK